MIKFEKVNEVLEVEGILEEGVFSFARVGLMSKLDSLAGTVPLKILTKLDKVLVELKEVDTHYSGEYTLKQWNKTSIKNLIKQGKESKITLDGKTVYDKMVSLKESL